MGYFEKKKRAIVYAKYNYAFIVFNEIEDFQINVTTVLGNEHNFNVIMANADTLQNTIELFNQHNFSTTINETFTLDAFFEMIFSADITINEHEYYDLSPTFIVKDAVNINVQEAEDGIVYNLKFDMDLGNALFVDQLEHIVFHFSFPVINLNVGNSFPFNVLLLEVLNEVLTVDVGDVTGVDIFSTIDENETLTTTIQKVNGENISVFETDISQLLANFEVNISETIAVNMQETLNIEYHVSFSIGTVFSLIALVEDVETLIVTMESIYVDVLSFYDEFYLVDLDNSTLADLDKN